MHHKRKRPSSRALTPPVHCRCGYGKICRHDLRELPKDKWTNKPSDYRRFVSAKRQQVGIE